LAVNISSLCTKVALIDKMIGRRVLLLQDAHIKLLSNSWKSNVLASSKLFTYKCNLCLKVNNIAKLFCVINYYITEW